MGSLWLWPDVEKDFCVSSDVRLALVEDRVTFGKDYITVPLMEIVEGGLRFPMPVLLRSFFSYFGLTPCQLSINDYRVIGCCIEICRRRNLEFRLCDLMGLFRLSRNRRSWKYFLSPRPPWQDVFLRLLDSEKWGSVYIQVYDAYNFSAGAEESNAAPIEW